MATVDVQQAGPAAAAGPTAPADLTQFDYLYDALTDKFPGLTGDTGGAAVFQFTAAPIAADWVTGNDAEAYNLANTVPLNLGGFYEPGNTLDNAFMDLILSVKPANYSDNAAYTQAQTALTGLTSSQGQIAANANSAYIEWAANNPGANGAPAETKTAWLLDPLGGAVWQAKLNQIQTQITNQSNKIAAIVASMDGALARAQAAASTDKMPISRGGGPAIQVPSVTIGGDLGGDLARWAVYPAGQYEFSVELEGSYTTTTPWKTLYTTSASQHCWQTSVSVDVDTSRIIQDVNYKLEVNAVGVESYQISRGQWYDADYVTPNVQLTPGTTVTSDTFFGLAGTLHLIPTELFVMYKPTFKLTISTATYQQQFVANANADIDWIDIFGFRFGFDGLASLQPVDNGNSTTTLTFASPDGAIPQIIGVTSKNEWNGSTTGGSNGNVSLAARPEAAARVVDPAPASEVVLFSQGVLRQSQVGFQPFANPTVIEVERDMPFGAAPFVVYNSNTHQTLGAGSCPALTAHPPYVNVYIPPNVPFTVQNLSTGVDIVVSW